ncbi:hypothetical protein [Microbacterium sp.]|uniref:hypothetical protein n=1 Tax=Microbacterium sp. TaxID=51671 RepID=UPI003A8AEFC6
MAGRTHVVGQAPTGSGKSLATLTAAFLAAIERDERTVISTDSLTLMGQLQDKDVATVTAAAAELHPSRDVRVAFVKGAANYVDPAKVIATAQTLTGTTSVSFEGLAERLEAGGALHGAAEFGDTGEEDAFRALVVWGLRQYTRDGGDGDRHSCPIEHTADAWQAISSPSSEADDGERFGVVSKAAAAKDRAGEADIIVTNHSILAVQAALGLPVIVGSARIGNIDHLIVDEAHTLPSHVRSQGASKLAGGTILSIARQGYRAAGSPSSGVVRRWYDEADTVAAYVDEALSSLLPGHREGVRKLTEHDNPIEPLAPVINDWVTVAGKVLLASAKTGDETRRLKLVAVADRLDKLSASVKALARHRSGWARWVERDRPADNGRRAWVSANVSPINVG